ncbi:hypothetical protein PFHG_04767 [Plasmodium falciparum HB3]|uniref:Uncharacterized protein n=1 Tax=Plasmodium falciparum (isolate HB3) TaxID=137071 RepID=A0A0L7KI18_PLAFX|nr:hypothetical protein PFHG_04767 [Plasmodium falciparum HB3]
MSIFKIPGLYSKIYGSIFRRKFSGPSPLYKTPLRHIWAIFFYIDIFILYILVFSFFFSIIVRNECAEIFSTVFFTTINIIFSFLIDFFFLLIKDEEVVSEDEIIVSTCLTILLCIVKIFLNLYSIYFCINVYGHIVESKERHIKETCASYMGKGLLLHYSVINCFSLVETYIESLLTLISIISFKAQVQSYQIII